MVKEKSQPEQHIQGNIDNLNVLILYNDDVNSFDYVIDALVEVCNHDVHQAEQCAWIAHYKGKCSVKEGGFNELKPLSDELTNRGLTVTIGT